MGAGKARPAGREPPRGSCVRSVVAGRSGPWQMSAEWVSEQTNVCLCDWHLIPQEARHRPESTPRRSQPVPQPHPTQVGLCHAQGGP